MASTSRGPGGAPPSRSRPATTRSSSSAAARARSRPPTRWAGWASSTRSSRPTRHPAACSAAGRSSSASCPGPSRTPRRPGRRHAFERYDWNSLLAEEPELRAIQVGLMDGSSDFPSRPEMERNLAAFADRAGIRIRYGCRWESTRREEGPDGDRFVLVTSDGEYRCRDAIFAVGVAEPWRPDAPGMDLVAHYADTRPAETYAGKRLFIVGKQNSGFELASGLLQWASRIVLASPSPGQALGQHAFPRRRSGALRPAVRGPQPGRRRLDPRRVDRPHRAIVRRRLQGPSASAATPAPRSCSRPTRSSPRRGSSRRCSTCRISASPRSARAGCRR